MLHKALFQGAAKQGMCQEHVPRAKHVPSNGDKPYPRPLGIVRRPPIRPLSHSIRQNSTKVSAARLRGFVRDQAMPAFIVGILAATSRTSIWSPSSDHGRYIMSDRIVTPLRNAIRPRTASTDSVRTMMLGSSLCALQ